MLCSPQLQVEAGSCRLESECPYAKAQTSRVIVSCSDVTDSDVGGTGMMSINLLQLSRAHRAHVSELTKSTLCCLID